MTAEKEQTNLFNAKRIASQEVEGVIFNLYENRIFHVDIPRYTKVGMNITQAGYRFLDAHGGGKFYNIYQFHSFSDVETETRKWAADPNGNKYTHTDAIVIGNLAQKIVTDFYVRFDRPVVPTKIFFTLEKAIEWTNTQIKS
jgi:hypothetical protein